MHIGFYYHVTANVVSPYSSHVPAWIGIYVAELARQAGRVTFYVHDSPLTGNEDFELREPMVRCKRLGPLRSAPARTFRSRRWLRRFQPSTDGVDVMLVRGPTPLLPHLARASDVPTALFLQGDLMTIPIGRNNPLWRRGLIEIWRRIYQRQQDAAVRDRLVLVNSPRLAESIHGAARLELVISSLVPTSVFDAGAPGERQWIENGKRPIRVLFTGRIAEEKGLFEAIEAVRILRDRGIDVRFEAVGSAENTSVHGALRAAIRSRGLEAYVSLLPFVPAGPALWEIYRQADIFLFPSNVMGEGIPHSLLEAMAASLPVVATRVGGIPRLLRDGKELVLVDARSPDSLAHGIERVATDPELRSGISREGWAWARKHSVERSCADTIRHLEAWRDVSRSVVAQ